MSKPLMYLLAGNGSAADWWDDALPYFQRYDVVPLELPGFGSNPQAPCEDLAAYAQALLTVTVKGSAIMAAPMVPRKAIRMVSKIAQTTSP